MAKSHASGGWASFPMPAQMKEFWLQVESGKITKEKLQLFLRGKNSDQDRIGEWQRFYQKYFGISTDFSNIKIPEYQNGFDRLLIIARGLTLNQVYDVCAKQFSCWRYADDLDKAITNNDRDPAKSAYAVWFRNRQEADEELKNLSADQLKEKGILGITLLERLLYELKYWDETNNHLDISNWTLCARSRNADGNVPDVHWDDDKLKVNWYYANNHNDRLRSRAAVPCLPAGRPVLPKAD